MFILFRVIRTLCFIGNRTANSLSNPINNKLTADKAKAMISPVETTILLSSNSIPEIFEIPKLKNVSPVIKSLSDRLKSSWSYSQGVYLKKIDRGLGLFLGV